MLIAFDCRIIRDRHPAGIQRVVLEFLKKLLAIDRKNEYILLFDNAELRDMVMYTVRHIKRKCRIVMLPFGILSMGDVSHLPRILRERAIDVYYMPYYITSPFHRGYKVVLTVFDLMHFFYPRLKMSPLRRVFHATRLFAKILFTRADRIITISVNTSRDLICRFHVSPRKVQLIYMGVSDHFRVIDQKRVQQVLKDSFSLQKPYFLFVGRNEPHKNLKALVVAYHFLPSPIKERYQLIIAGKEDPRYSASLHDIIDKLHLTNHVVFTGYVDDANLPFLYNGASAFVLPSLYEGFGLPILEAMACGVPVITSTSSALPEVGGDAALYADPHDVDRLSRHMEDLVTNERLRGDLVEKGFRQIKKFTWSGAVEGLLKLFDELGK